MKKITLLTLMFWAFVPKSTSQCTEPVPLPYLINFDAVILPDLPDCTFSNRQTFVGNDWEAAAAPNSSFTGNVARYSTITDVGWGMACSYFIRSVQLTPGMAYKVSYKYAHNENETAIDALRATLFSGTPQPEILLATHEGITGTELVNFATELFTVPVTDIYYLRFDIESSGNQGILYLDDIKIEEMGVMATNEFTTAKLSCYPNPVKDIVTITGAAGLEKLELYNIAGQLLLTEDNATVNLEAIPSGIYLLKVQSGAAATTLQIIKE